MKKIVLGLLVLTTILSCKKDDNKSDNSDSVCKISELKTKTGKLVNRYDYTADDKINMIEEYDTTTGISESSIVFQYSGNTVTRKRVHSDGDEGLRITYLLNSSGWAERKITKSPMFIDTVKYEYNDQGNLIRAIGRGRYLAHEPNDTISFTYNEGKRTSMSSDGDSIKFEYHDFKIPLHIKKLLENSYETLGDYIDEEIFLGNNTDLAIKSITHQFSPNDPHTIVYEYTYQFDHLNNLTNIYCTIGYKNSYSLHSFEMKVNVWCN